MAKKGGVIRRVAEGVVEIGRDVVKEGGRELLGEGLKENIDIAIGRETNRNDNPVEKLPKSKKERKNANRAVQKERAQAIEYYRRVLAEEQQVAYEREKKRQEELANQQREQKETGKAFIFPIVKPPKGRERRSILSPFKPKATTDIPESVERIKRKIA